MEASRAKGTSMTEKEYIERLEFLLDKTINERDRLRTEAQRVVDAFTKPQDYHVWDEALNKLEDALKGEMK